MKIAAVAALLSFALFGALGALAKSQGISIPTGPGIHEDWVDAKRNRTVPVRMMLPPEGTAKAPYPVVIFSHGLGGSREGASYLGDYWTKHGYFVIYVQHPGSDAAVWQSALQHGRDAMMANMRQAANGENLIARAGDIHFVIDQLATKNESDPQLRGKLDMSRIAITGHSFGAGTALAIAGQKYGPMKLDDPRIKCAIYFSPPVPSVHPKQIYSDIKVPGMLMTGTEDNSPIGNTPATDRRVPFDGIGAGDQYLINFTGGDHMIFSGRLMRNDKDGFFQPRIVKMSTEFLDAYLKGDQQAKAWLKNDAAAYLKDSATYELH